MTKPDLDIRVRVVAQEDRALGPGKADLLHAIEQAGSISAAAKQLKMSYSRAWQLVDSMNRAFRAPLVEAATGGARGGGATVTPAGRKALELYRRLQDDLAACAQSYAPAFEKLLK